MQVLTDVDNFSWAHPYYKRQVDCIPATGSSMNGHVFTTTMPGMPSTTTMTYPTMPGTTLLMYTTASPGLLGDMFAHITELF